MKIAQRNITSKANTDGKGFRTSKNKLVPPQVTDVDWASANPSFFTMLAQAKLESKGKTGKLPTSKAAIYKIALALYAPKDLAFILQGIGYTTRPFPKSKSSLINKIVSVLNDNEHLSNNHDEGSDKNEVNSVSLMPSSPTTESNVAAECNNDETE